MMTKKVMLLFFYQTSTHKPLIGNTCSKLLLVATKLHFRV